MTFCGGYYGKRDVGPGSWIIHVGLAIAAMQHYVSAPQQRRKLMRFPDIIDGVYMTVVGGFVGGFALAVGATGFISAVAACGGLPSYHVD
jgi:hypothetical protein